MKILQIVLAYFAGGYTYAGTTPFRPVYGKGLKKVAEGEKFSFAL
jgi:hypothetical protein